MAKALRYSDVDLTFSKNPITGDISRLTNEDAVKRSIINLVLTSRYERLFRPAINGGISDKLFESIDALSATVIEDNIRNVISQHEPRVILTGVSVVGNPSQNSFEAKITFNVINIDKPQTVSITLERTR